MESIDYKILKSLKKRGRGTVFYADEYAHYANPNRVRKALEQLTKAGQIIRVARGIYCFPKKDKLFGTGYLLPSFDDVAVAIAKRDGARIVPTGVHALNRVGLSTQLPMNFVYLTDGKSRKVTLLDGHSLQFIHTSPKNLQFHNQQAMIITFALKEIGKNNLTDEQLTHIVKLLNTEGKDKIMQDIALMPDWIQNIVQQAYYD